MHHFLWCDPMWPKKKICVNINSESFPTAIVEKAAQTIGLVQTFCAVTTTVIAHHTYTYHNIMDHITSGCSQGIIYIYIQIWSKFKANTRTCVSCWSQIVSNIPCHATMMLPGTYWALVESILYSSWYLDAAHMDTDKHRLGKSGAERAVGGRKRGKSRKKMRLRMHSAASWVRVKPFHKREEECDHRLCSKTIQNGIG